MTYSIVNGLYNITTESIKLVLDVEQFGASSDLIVPTYDVQKMSFSFFFYASSLRHFMDSIEMPLSNFSLEFITKSITSIKILCCLLYLQHKVWLKIVGFMATKISTCQTYQLFSPYTLWDKYLHTPILLVVILSFKTAFVGVKINLHFQTEAALRNSIARLSNSDTFICLLQYSIKLSQK